MTAHWDTVVDVDFRAGEHRFRDVSGWSEPEWTDGKRFSIELGPVPDRNRLVLRLRASPYLAQRFELSCNGIRLGDHAAATGFVAVFPIPQGAVGKDRSFPLVIEIASPKRPRDHAVSADERQLGLAIERLEVLGTDATEQQAWPGALPARRTTDDRDLLGCFESLGDNCELGFVQKRLGVAESSLLRFCATPVDKLLDGLAHGFSGIAEAASVVIVEDGPEGAVEYQIRLRRYGLHYHTLVFTHEARRDEVLDRELSKLRHKHAKFLAGLASGDRIYVLKQNDGLAAATIWSVWLALQRHGPNTLLVVRAAAPGEMPGRVEVRAPGLMEATIASFADYTDATLGDDGAWIDLCRLAHGIAVARAAAARSPETMSSALAMADP